MGLGVTPPQRSSQCKLMVFHWSLSDSKSPQVSRTLLSILAIFNNAVVWMVSTRPPTSKSSRPFNNPLVIVPEAPITIGIIVTFTFHSFFNSLARSRYLSFSHSFSFILWSAGTAKSTILQIYFFFVIIIIIIIITLLKSPVKLATVVEGDKKALFSIATTSRCRGGCYSFPWIAPLYS